MMPFFENDDHFYPPFAKKRIAINIISQQEGGKKVSIQGIHVLEVLKKYSDENHPLTTNQILNYLVNSTGKKCTRQTIYKKIEELQNQGIEILLNNNREGYYFADHLLEDSEVELLCHSVIGNNTIPLEQSNQLLDKVLSTKSIYFQERFKSKLNLYNQDKKENKQIFYNIDVISRAIDENHSIHFQYTRYNYKKEIIPKREKRYTLIPCGLFFKNNRLYVVGWDEKHEAEGIYRVDKMIEVEQGGKNEIEISIDILEYLQGRLYAYSGEIQKCRIRFDESVLDELIDLFGKGIELTPCIGGFEATLETTKQEIIYFAFQFMNHVQVLEPEEVVNEIKATLTNGLKTYKEGEKKL